MSDDYLSIMDCRRRGLYRVKARNFSLAAYEGGTPEPPPSVGLMFGFIGIREKFGRTFLDTEYHWDGRHFASAKPLELLEMVPEHIELNEDSDNRTLFTYLLKRSRRVV